MTRRIGVLTGGGDAPGLNAVIRAVVLSAAGVGVECVGIEDGFDGLANPVRARPLASGDVGAILSRGGTILGTTNESGPFGAPPDSAPGADDVAVRLANFHALALNALVVIGGDGTLAMAYDCHRRGMPVIGVPKTIDNDIVETSATFGFDTAVGVAAEAVDRVRASAESHHRILVVEVMGHDSGWLALSAAIAGGADAALIPEIPFDLRPVAERVLARERAGVRFAVVVIADEARSGSADGEAGAREPADRLARLRGIGERVARDLERPTGKSARHVVLGHVQRGGAPSAADRVLATRLGAGAIDLFERGEFGVMAALQAGRVVAVPLDQVVGRVRRVPLDGDLIAAARRVGICLGD